MVPIAESVDVFYTPHHLRPQLEELPLEELQSLVRYLPKSVRQECLVLEKLPKPELLTELCRLVAVRSQIHTGAFLYQRFMGCPLMKRDLYYRLEYWNMTFARLKRTSIRFVLTNIFEDVLADMRKKGSVRDLSYWNMAKFAEGIL